MMASQHLIVDNHTTNLSNRLQELQMKGILCDTFLIGNPGCTVKVHSAVLASCSGSFLSMLPSIDTGGRNLFTLNIPNASQEMLDTLVKYVYTGTISFCMNNLLDLANMFNIAGFRDAYVACLKHQESLKVQESDIVGGFESQSQSTYTSPNLYQEQKHSDKMEHVSMLNTPKNTTVLMRPTTRCMSKQTTENIGCAIANRHRSRKVSKTDQTKPTLTEKPVTRSTRSFAPQYGSNVENQPSRTRTRSGIQIQHSNDDAKQICLRQTRFGSKRPIQNVQEVISYKRSRWKMKPKKATEEDEDWIPLEEENENWTLPEEEDEDWTPPVEKKIQKKTRRSENKDLYSGKNHCIDTVQTTKAMNYSFTNGHNKTELVTAAKDNRVQDENRRLTDQEDGDERQHPAKMQNKITYWENIGKAASGIDEQNMLPQTPKRITDSESMNEVEADNAKSTDFMERNDQAKKAESDRYVCKTTADSMVKVDQTKEVELDCTKKKKVPTATLR